MNTHKDLFQYTPLPFGVFSAPSIFQQMMDNILQGIQGVCAYIDDTLVSGKTREDHLAMLEAVFACLKEAGLLLKREKNYFMLPSVEYLGFKISAEGVQPTQEKIKVVQDAPPPRDISQLKAFLGSVNYYGKFLPDLSFVLTAM